MKNETLIPWAIISAGVILAIAVYYTALGVAPPPSPSGGNPSLVRQVNTEDHLYGNPTAPVIIVEYSDFECPYCKTFDGIMRQLMSEYGPSGKVAWVFRNFPIVESHEHAWQHARAAECVARVGGNDAYWEFTNLLFMNQPATPTKYAEYALASGAEPGAVGTCIQQAQTNGIDELIEADSDNALTSGARGTPYSLILITGKTPRVIDGAWGYGDLKDQLDLILGEL